MNLIPEAFQRLFPGQPFPFQPVLKYNKKLHDFNASLRLQNNLLRINLNHRWKSLDREIQIGLIQTLLLKIFSKKYDCPLSTFNIDLYHNFIKKIPLLTPKTQTSPLLEDSFHRVNQEYFIGLLEKPNLVWGTFSSRKLAYYNFHTDTITVSSLFQAAPLEILDYLIYHELLHKKQKFYYKNNRSYFHTRKFREAENLFPNKKQIEKEVSCFIKTYKKQNQKPALALLNRLSRLFSD